MPHYPLPQHTPDDHEYVARMQKAIRSGRPLPPIVTTPDGVHALCGSHRLAAWRNEDAPPNTLALTKQEYQDACDYLLCTDLTDCKDGESVCRAIYATSHRQEIRDALVDQL